MTPKQNLAFLALKTAVEKRLVKHGAATIKQECYHCRNQIWIRRTDVVYWPDHLWAGKVTAIYCCKKCGKKSFIWAHTLPIEWEQDWPRPDWESVCLPMLHQACHNQGIEESPGTYPTSKFWKRWRKENGFTLVQTDEIIPAKLSLKERLMRIFL